MVKMSMASKDGGLLQKSRSGEDKDAELISRTLLNSDQTLVKTSNQVIIESLA